MKYWGVKTGILCKFKHDDRDVDHGGGLEVVWRIQWDGCATRRRTRWQEMLKCVLPLCWSEQHWQDHVFLVPVVLLLNQTSYSGSSASMNDYHTARCIENLQLEWSEWNSVNSQDWSRELRFGNAGIESFLYDWQLLVIPMPKKIGRMKCSVWLEREMYPVDVGIWLGSSEGSSFVHWDAGLIIFQLVRCPCYPTFSKLVIRKQVAYQPIVCSVDVWEFLHISRQTRSEWDAAEQISIVLNRVLRKLWVQLANTEAYGTYFRLTIETGRQGVDEQQVMAVRWWSKILQQLLRRNMRVCWWFCGWVCSMIERISIEAWAQVVCLGNILPLT